MPHAPITPTLIVTWRSENYGRFDGARSAFRLYDTVDLDDAAVAGISFAAIEAGYFWDDGRCAWIAWADSARGRFIAGLHALGYAIEHAGSWRGPEDHPQAPPASDPEAR